MGEGHHQVMSPQASQSVLYRFEDCTSNLSLDNPFSTIPGTILSCALFQSPPFLRVPIRIDLLVNKMRIMSEALPKTLLFMAVLLVPQTCLAFVSPTPVVDIAPSHVRASSPLSAIPHYDAAATAASILDSSSHILSTEVDRESAKGDFYFYFLLGSGAGGIGLAQIPRIYSELSAIRSLGTEGPSSGGETVNAGLSSLIFPRMYIKDVEQVISKVPTVEQIRKQGTSTSYLASKGYIDRDDFIISLKQCNPLASYALFEALSGGSGGSISPTELERKLDIYRSANDPVAAFVSDLQEASLKKLGAYFTLAFLLCIVWAPIINSAVTGFF